MVLGNECPCKKSCAGRLSFPALSKTGNGQVLLSGCFHNVGRAVLKPDLKPTPEVALTEAVHCSFQLHLDEWSDGGQWDLATKNLVRFAAQVFKQSGHAQALSHPWARSFRKGSSPSTPALCDMVQFSAKVDRSSLASLLQSSGHNRIYMNSRSWSGAVLDEWAVVWTTVDRSEATRLAMAVAGLVRSKARGHVSTGEAVAGCSRAGGRSPSVQNFALAARRGCPVHRTVRAALAGSSKS